MKTIITLFICILLVSCNHLERGTVLKKEYEPAHTYTYLQRVQIGKVASYIPHRIHDNEDFILTIEGEYEGQVIHEHVYVSKACYEQIGVGATWTKTQDCSFQDENNTKERE